MKQKRKKIGRKLLSFLLTLAMLVGLMPGMSFTVKAANVENAPTLGNSVLSGTGWSWNADTKTLTISGVNWSSTLVMPAGSKLVLADGTRNTIIGSGTTEVYYGSSKIGNIYTGLYGEGALTISGGGELYVYSDSNLNDKQSDRQRGICVNGELTISSDVGTVYAKAGSSNFASGSAENYCDIYAATVGIGVHGNYIQNGGNVEGVAGTGGYQSIGIAVGRGSAGITVDGTNAVLTGRGGDATNHSFGLCCGSEFDITSCSIDIKNGKVNLYAADCSRYSYGLFGGNGCILNVSGGEITAIGKKPTGGSRGLRSRGGINISGGVLYVEGLTSALYAGGSGISGDISITDGMLVAKTGSETAVQVDDGKITLATGLTTKNVKSGFTSGSSTEIYVDDKSNPVRIGNLRYYVQFDVQNHGDSPETQYFNTDGEGKVNRPEDPVTSGYVFGGWFEEPDCKNAWDFENMTVTSDKILYAKWTPILADDEKPKVNDLVCNGQPQPLVAEPENLPDGYTDVLYSQDGEDWSEDIPTGKDAGTYTIKVKYISDDYHDDFIGDEITVIIAPAVAQELTDIQKPKANNLIYNGQPQSLVTAPKELPEGYSEMQYALAENATIAPEAGKYTTSIPTATNAGTYYVWYKVVGDANHNDSGEKCVTVTIAPVDKTALNKAIKEAEDYYNTIKDNADYSKQAEDLSKAINTAKELSKDNNAKDDDVSAGITAVTDAKNKAAFDVEKTTQKNAVDALAEAEDSDASKKLITDAKAAIDGIAYDESKTLADNKAAIGAITTKLKTDLTAQRAADKKDNGLEAAKKEAQAAMNEQVTVTQKGKKIIVKWKKSISADGYDVYVQYCGKKATKPAVTIEKNTTTNASITKINNNKIDLKKQFKVYVEAYKMVDGEKVVLGKSNVGHIVGVKNSKYTNVKSIKLTKSKYTVKVGKTAKIKAKIALVDKSKKHISTAHGAKFRYKSSDTSIATVDKNGKIKGISKGTCTIYVYAINGKMKKAKVTVK